MPGCVSDPRLAASVGAFPHRPPLHRCNRSADPHVTGLAGDATLSSRSAVSRLRSLARPPRFVHRQGAMVRASLFNGRLAASPRRAHDSPPSSASPHSRRPPRSARSLQRSPQQRAPLDCRRHAPAFGTDPPPRPVSPRTRFAPPLRHSATRAFPPPSDRSARPPSPRRCGLRPSPASASRHAPCPHHCGCPRGRFRQRAAHVCRQRLQH